MILMICLITNNIFAQNSFVKKVYKHNSDSLLYNLLNPVADVNNKFSYSEKYPLVIFLHGSGERGFDNEKQIIHIKDLFLTKENQNKYPAFVIAPQCPIDQKWVDIKWAEVVHRMPEKISKSLELTLNLIDSLVLEYPIDSNRIYITGLSMGGYGVWDIICRFPGKFAAAVPVCGGGDFTKAYLIKDLPIWAFHGSNDKVVPVQNTRSMIKEIQLNGGHPKYYEYKGVGHDSWIKAFKEEFLLEWIFKQRK